MNINIQSIRVTHKYMLNPLEFDKIQNLTDQKQNPKHIQILFIKLVDKGSFISQNFHYRNSHH